MQQRSPAPQSSFEAQLMRSCFGLGALSSASGESLAQRAFAFAHTQIGADAGQRWSPVQVARASAGAQVPARQAWPTGHGKPPSATQLSSAQLARAPERGLQP